MKRRMIYLLILCTLAMSLLSGCNSTLKPPGLTLKYDDTEYNALLGTYGWKSFGRAVEADSDGPLGWQDIITTIEQNTNSKKLKLIFAKTPDEYSIRCWSDDHWDDNDAYQEHNEVVINDDTITLLSDDGYIYEVYATWKGHGDAYYGFFVTAP